jgi:membrane associated rhomboid family serine protease
MKPFTRLAVAVFALVALIQLVRVVLGWDVSIAGVAIPAWASVIAFLVAAVLAVMVHRELRR